MSFPSGFREPQVPPASIVIGLIRYCCSGSQEPSPRGIPLDRVITMREVGLLVAAVGLIYLVLRIWRRGPDSDSWKPRKGFRPRIGFSRQDGMASVSLLLANRSEEPVWVEEIEIYLTSLVANDQVVEPSFQEIKKIRQVVPPDDMLPVSLAQVIYKAAGNPQRRYSCVISSVLRFRIGKKWSEQIMPNHKLQMAGLTADSIGRERKHVPAFPSLNKSAQEAPAESVKLE
jgi:hypothetical protein